MSTGLELQPPRNVDKDGNRFHYLKTWTVPWHDIEAGRKPFEYRKHDRDYRVGDILVLEEYEPNEGIHTNKALERRVTYLLPGGTFGVPEGYCVMGLEPWPSWSDGDRPLPEDESIKATHPIRSGRYDLHRTAMRLVGARHSKHALVELVNWLLHRIEQVATRHQRTGEP